MLVYKKKFEGVLIREGMFIGRRVLRDIISVISEIFESLSNSLKKKKLNLKNAILNGPLSKVINTNFSMGSLF